MTWTEIGEDPAMEQVKALKGEMRQYLQDLEYFWKAHASDYAARRKAELKEFLEKLGDV